MNVSPLLQASATRWRRAAVLILSSILGLAGASEGRAASAGPPDFMTYQGFLADGSGVALAPTTPINYSVVFRIYDAQSGGNLIWAEVQTVTVDRGQFSVVLGEGAQNANEPRPSLGAVFASPSASDRFLDMTVTIGGNPLNISPRLRFLTSPYSFLATQANSLVSPAGTTLLSASPNGDLNIAGTITTPGAIGNQATSATRDNLANQIVLRDGTGSFNAQNIGLSGNLNANLVNANFVRAASISPTHQQGAHLAWNRDGRGASWILNQKGLGVGGMVFGEVDAALGVTERMRIAPDGRVGIGTVAPEANLVVRAPVGPAQLFIESTAGQVSQLFLRENGVLRSAASYVPGDGTFRLYNNGIDSIIMDTVGRVGITGGASGTFQVNATAANRGSGTAVFVATDIAGGASPSHVHFGNLGDWYIRSADNAGRVFIQDLGGQATVGTTAAFGTFHVQSNAADPGEGTAVFSAAGINGVTRSHIHHGANGDIIWRSASSNGKVVLQDTGGNVGIGAAFPTQAKLVVDGVAADQIGTHYTFAGNIGVSGPHTGTFNTTDVSIKASRGIHAEFIRALSDARIKRIAGRSDSAADLETVNAIEITDYVYRDPIGRGDRPQKKVIGQQVERVFPQAVTQSTDVVPDIYERAAINDGWIQLDADLVVGDRVKLIADKERGVYEVLEVRDGQFRTEFTPNQDVVFVFGREVEDFRVVDYEAIAMLNVSATQELARRVQALQRSEERIADLEQAVANLPALEAKATQVDALVKEVVALRALVKEVVAGRSGSDQLAVNSAAPVQN